MSLLIGKTFAPQQYTRYTHNENWNYVLGFGGFCNGIPFGYMLRHCCNIKKEQMGWENCHFSCVPSQVSFKKPTKFLFFTQNINPI